MKFSADYFMLGHWGMPLAARPANRRRYVASLKHALLFTQRIALADSMIVNAPNFRAAFHSDDAFRKIILSGLVEVIHLDKYLDGPFFTLPEMRAFHAGQLGRDNGPVLFQPGVPAMFRTSEFDHELATIQAEAPQRCPEPFERDPYFSALVAAHMEQDFLKADLGDLYGLYANAYEIMRADQDAYHYPYFGIIHFDPNHNDGNIFDYMARTDAARQRGLLKKDLIKLIGRPVLRSHQALLLNSELQGLKTKAILPPELDRYKTLVMNSADEAKISDIDREFVSKAINLDAFTVESFAALALEDIIEIRKAGEGYFAMLEQVRSGSMPFSEVVATLEDYINRISVHLYRLNKARPEKPVRPHRLTVLAGKLVNWGARPGSAATVIKLTGKIPFLHYVSAIIDVVAERAGAQVSSFLGEAGNVAGRREAAAGAVRSEIVYRSSDYLTQYRR